ncbi:MAG: hypothetical protein OEY41_14575, partial [Acidimicrobiia bacterium]|nr:hypothetical protein [Acidimicrobiia bacterium]
QSFALVGDKAVYGGALLAEYGRFAETTASRLEILKNRLVGLAIDIGTPLLGGIAAAADGIGDAVLALQGALGPLAAALAETFGNGAKIIGVFASTLGPTLSGAVATLGALAQIVGSLIGVFNGLGPAGLVVAALAADLYLVGPASVAAAAGLAAFKAAAVEVGVASALARGGMAALSAALPMAPVAVAVAGLYLLGKAMQDAKSRAQELSQELSLNLARSLETGDWNAFASQVSSTQTRIKELNSELRGSDLSWDTIKKGARAVFEVLPFVDNQLLNTAAEMKGLQGVLDDPNFGDNFRSNVAALAYDMGISSEAAFGLIVATNNLSQAQVGGVESYEKIQAAAENYIAELTGMTGASEEAVTGMLEEGLTVERLAQAYGVSMDTIKQAMAEAKLTEEDLFDPKKYDEVVEALSGVIGPWERLGEAAGLTADQIAAADAQTKLLIASQKELADSFDKVKAARAAAEFPIENLRQATEAYAKATEEYKNGKITLEQYGQALLGLNSAQAAVAPTVNAALDAQAKNAAAFRETALKAGETEQAITDVLVSWGLLSRAEAAELKVKGGDVLDLARRRILDLREQLRDKFIAEMAVERGTTEADIERLLARGDEWATSVFEAKMDAATEAPFREIADLMVQAGVWDALEAEAFLSADPATAFAIIESAFGKMETWKGPWIGIMTADNSDVEAREGASRALLQGFVDTEWKGYLTADNSDVQARESESRVTLTSFRDEKWQAMLTADNTDALSKASQASDENNRYKDAQYQARLTSDNTDALSKKSQASDENNRYAQAKYEARLTSNNSDSLSKSKQASDEANRYGALRPNAVLSATDNASGVIQGAIDRLKGFQSKSITITATTINQSVGASATSNRIGNNAFPAANGMILRSFASGG